jgi:hypothetical protein
VSIPCECCFLHLLCNVRCCLASQLASSPEKWRGTSEDHNKDVEETEESETNDVLFFVDAQGSSELLQQCQVRSSS